MRDAAGVAYTHPWLGGLNVPRPQFLDIDADGDLDLFVQERPGVLMFFENTGTATAYRFTWRSDAFGGLDVGEWARFGDLDGDGDYDVLAEEPFSFVRYYRNVGTPAQAQFDLARDTLQATYLDDEGLVRDTVVFSDRQNLPALADVDCDGHLDLFIGTLDGFLSFYAHEGVGDDGVPAYRFMTDRFQDIAIIGGFGKKEGSRSNPAQHGANAIAFTDIDGDDDLDLFWGDFFSPSLYFLENTGVCDAAVFERTSDVFPVADPLETSGFNTPVFADLDADGDDDLFVGILGGAFGGGLHPVDNFYFYRHDERLAFALQTRQVIASLDVDEDSTPAFVDLDADGDLDLVVGNKIDRSGLERGQLFLFDNDGAPGAPAFRLVSDRLVDLAERHFNTAPAFADLDADGDQDLLVGGFDGKLALYRNDGTPTAPAFGVPDTLTYVTIEGQRRTLDIGQSSTPALVDVDADGDVDLLVGESSGRLNLYRNAGTPDAPNFVLLAADSLTYQRLGGGARSLPVLHDVSGDGLLDLVVGTGADGVLVYRNTGTPQEASFVFDGVLPVPGTVPRDAAPAFADLDGDGDDDLFFGGLTGGLFYYRNDAIITATHEPPLPPSEPWLHLSNYPNPFRTTTTLHVRLARPGRVRLAVYDVLGRVVAVPVNGFMTPGDHPVPFAAGHLPAGVYLYTLSGSDGAAATGMMMRVK